MAVSPASIWGRVRDPSKKRSNDRPLSDESALIFHAILIRLTYGIPNPLIPRAQKAIQKPTLYHLGARGPTKGKGTHEMVSSERTPTFRRDTERAGTYHQVNEEKVVCSVSLSDLVIADYDAGGAVRGLEFAGKQTATLETYVDLARKTSRGMRRKTRGPIPGLPKAPDRKVIVRSFPRHWQQAS